MRPAIATMLQRSSSTRMMVRRRVVTPLEFVIPREATQDGVLELSWQRVTGRGTQVAEVWLIKQ